MLSNKPRRVFSVNFKNSIISCIINTLLKMNSLKCILVVLFFTLIYEGHCQNNSSLIKVTVTDQLTGNPTAVRVKITDSEGHVAGLPEEAISIMYGRDDKPERYGYQPDSTFYSNGHFSLDLHPGNYKVSLSKGFEYEDRTLPIEVKQGGNNVFRFEMKRWIKMSDLGWYSADDHIHIRRSPKENPSILKWVEAEGLNVGVLLQMGDFWATYFSQYAFGKEGTYTGEESLLSTGQEEPRTHEIGHTIALVADDFVRYQNEYYNYDKIFDKVHDLDGIMGYAHQGMSFNGSRGMTLDVLSGRVDFLELLQFCVEGGPLLTQNYYHFLDLGYKLTATAGSDFPWCGNGPRYGIEGPDWNARIGNARFYTWIDGAFEYATWKKNLKEGHTFVSSGPMLIFSVDGHLPGDEIKMSGPGKVSIEAKAYGNKGQIPLSKLEIIGHGKVLKQVIPDGDEQTLENMELNFDLEIKDGIWIAARCFAGPTQVAHTTPIYINVENNGFHNPETLQEYLTLNEKYLDDLEKELEEPNDRVDKRAWWYRDGLQQRIEETRMAIESLREK